MKTAKVKINLEPRSHSVTGNVRSGKVRQYTIFHWPLKKGCGNAIYAPIGLFCGSCNEGLVLLMCCFEEIPVVRSFAIFRSAKGLSYQQQE